MILLRKLIYFLALQIMKLERIALYAWGNVAMMALILPVFWGLYFYEWSSQFLLEVFNWSSMAQYMYFCFYQALMLATLVILLSQILIWLLRRVSFIKAETTQMAARYWWCLWLTMVPLLTWFIAWTSEQNIYHFEVFFSITSMIAGLAVIFYAVWGAKILMEKMRWRRNESQELTIAEREKVEKRGRLIWRIIWIALVTWLGGSAIFFIVWLTIPDGPRASRYAVLNAALKNTCLIDPQKVNCPSELIELSYIEPVNYRYLLVDENVQANYVYDQASGFYTFVVRYQPDRAVIFDWRLTDELGVDFLEVELDLWRNEIRASEWKILGDVPGEWWQFEEWDWES